MPRAKPASYTTEAGRVICKDGKPYLMIAIPSDFFSRLVMDSDGTYKPMGASQEEADALTLRIAYLLAEYGEHE